jgi:hypothetical protein
MQAFAPASVLAVPAAQRSHVVALSSAANVPGAQAVGATSPAVAHA